MFLAERGNIIQAIASMINWENSMAVGTRRKTFPNANILKGYSNILRQVFPCSIQKKIILCCGHEYVTI